MRIDKYIADCGGGSRKDVKAYIKSGRVSVNGAVITNNSAHIDEKCDEVLKIAIEDKKVEALLKKIKSLQLTPFPSLG